MGVTTKFSQKEEEVGQSAEKTKKREKSGGGGGGGGDGETRGRDPATLVLENRLGHHPVHQLALGQILVGVLAVTSQLVVSLVCHTTSVPTLCIWNLHAVWSALGLGRRQWSAIECG